jgi:CHASE2 domain-containing sensor protein
MTSVLDSCWNPPPDTEHTIVILNVDQRSLESLGQWPWSRFDLGDIVDQLTNYGALVVGWDFIFPEYERNVAVELQDQIAEGRGHGLEDLLPRLEECGILSTVTSISEI